MLLRRLLHVLCVVALVGTGALLGPHIHAQAGGLDGLPYALACAYALVLAFAATTTGGALAGAWTLCHPRWQQALALLAAALFIAWPSYEIGTHIARGDGISQWLAPEYGRVVVTLLLTFVSTTAVATLAAYIASGWHKRPEGELRRTRTAVRLTRALLYLGTAGTMWVAPPALNFFGTTSILIYAWFVLFASVALLLFWRPVLWVDLALLALVAWPTYQWQLEPEAARALLSASAARFRPLSDVSEAWPLHQDFSKPRYQLLTYDCRKVSVTACGPSAGETKHVILISVDALRKDALDWTDAEGDSLTPNIGRFALQSIAYERATTNYPATLLALGSVVSGLSPIELTLAEKPPSIVLDAVREGISTHAIFPSSRWFSMSSFGRLVLNHFEHIERATSSNDAVATALEVLRSRSPDERLFLWLHLYDPHEPYVRHPEFGLGDSIEDRYKGEVATTDFALGPLFDELQKEPWSGEATVIFFSDHGESIVDYVGHHVYLNRAIADVPMLVRAPGVTPKRTGRVATMQDVTATVRHVLGLRPVCGSEQAYDLRRPAQIPDDRAVVAEAFSMRGSTLFHFLNTPVRSKEAVEMRLQMLDRPADYEPKTAIISATHRSVFYHRSGRFEIFDRSAEKEEPLSSQTTPTVRKQMKTHLRRWMQAAPLRASCQWR